MHRLGYKNIVNETQFVLQYMDSGIISEKDGLERLEELIGSLENKDQKTVIRQCYDRQLFSEEEIQIRWKFDVWEDKNKLRS